MRVARRPARRSRARAGRWPPTPRSRRARGSGTAGRCRRRRGRCAGGRGRRRGRSRAHDRAWAETTKGSRGSPSREPPAGGRLRTWRLRQLFETHFPKALRLFLLVPYFAANASRPSDLRSAAQSLAALLRALIFVASASSAFVPWLGLGRSATRTCRRRCLPFLLVPYLAANAAGLRRARPCTPSRRSWPRRPHAAPPRPSSGATRTCRTRSCRSCSCRTSHGTPRGWRRWCRARPCTPWRRWSCRSWSAWRRRSPERAAPGPRPASEESSSSGWSFPRLWAETRARRPRFGSFRRTSTGSGRFGTTVGPCPAHLSPHRARGSCGHPSACWRCGPTTSSSLACGEATRPPSRSSTSATFPGSSPSAATCSAAARRGRTPCSRRSRPRTADLLRSEREVNFKPWLYTIARNRCVSVLRARRETAQIESEIPTAGLSEQVEQRADLRELLSDLHDLPTDQRAALVLTELRGPLAGRGRPRCSDAGSGT